YTAYHTEGRALEATTQRLVEALETDGRNEVADIAGRLDPENCTMSATALYTVAKYIELKADKNAQNSALAVKWYLAAHSADSGGQSIYRAARIRERMKDWQ